MPAPTSAELSAIFATSYGGPLGEGGVAYLEKLFGGISQGWENWQKSLTWGGVLVKGSGVGAWVGIGNGGKFLPAPFVIPTFSFEADTPQQKKFTQSLSTAISQKFGEWVASFVLAGASYTGVSTATPTSAGAFKAVVASVPVGSSGSGTNPKGIADLWQSMLTPPDFNLSSPQGNTTTFSIGMAQTIEKAFETVWLVKTQLSANSVSGPASAGSGTGISTSLSDGMLL